MTEIIHVILYIFYSTANAKKLKFVGKEEERNKEGVLAEIIE